MWVGVTVLKICNATSCFHNEPYQQPGPAKQFQSWLGQRFKSGTCSQICTKFEKKNLQKIESEKISRSSISEVLSSIHLVWRLFVLKFQDTAL